jgi:hypothetical protein
MLSVLKKKSLIPEGPRPFFSKKWGCCTPILPKCQEVPQNSKNKNKNKNKKEIKNFEKIDCASIQGCTRRPPGRHQLAGD